MEQWDPDATFDITRLIPHPRELIRNPAYERGEQSTDNKAHLKTDAPHTHQRTD
jgi:hypothetical protein